MNDDYPYRSPPDAKAWQPEWPALKQRQPEPEVGLSKLAVIVAVVVSIASVGNATMVPVTRGTWIISLAMDYIVCLSCFGLVAGSIGGQAAVLTVLLVWGAGPLWRRLAWHWGLATLAFSAWTLGMIAALADQPAGSRYLTGEELKTVLLGLPLVALAWQIAPWMIKLYFQWRIELPNQANAPAVVERLSIRDIFYGTILVAAPMAALRLGKPVNAEIGIYWARWGIGGALAAGTSLLCLVPMVYLTLGVRRAWVGAIEVAMIATSIAVVGSVIFILLIPGGLLKDKEIILMMVSVAAGFTITLAGTLWIARAYGYRLVMGRVQSPDQWSG